MNQTKFFDFGKIHDLWKWWFCATTMKYPVTQFHQGNKNRRKERKRKKNHRGRERERGKKEERAEGDPKKSWKNIPSWENGRLPSFWWDCFWVTNQRAMIKALLLSLSFSLYLSVSLWDLNTKAVNRRVGRRISEGLLPVVVTSFLHVLYHESQSGMARKGKRDRRI